ncbi:Pr6Pr family membrane protein [Tessaracoccus terricola]
MPALGIELPQGSTLAWSNEVLHVVVPLAALLDWVFAPGRRRLGWSAIWAVLAFPVVWVVYTLARGPFTPNEVTGDEHWYPYPFLNPNLAESGYLSVALYVVAIAVVITAVAAVVVWVSRLGVRSDVPGLPKT